MRKKREEQRHEGRRGFFDSEGEELGFLGSGGGGEEEGRGKRGGGGGGGRVGSYAFFLALVLQDFGFNDFEWMCTNPRDRVISFVREWEKKL